MPTDNPLLSIYIANLRSMRYLYIICNMFANLHPFVTERDNIIWLHVHVPVVDLRSRMRRAGV